LPPYLINDSDLGSVTSQQQWEEYKTLNIPKSQVFSNSSSSNSTNVRPDDDDEGFANQKKRLI
jgi:hypothetical protein